MSAIPQSGADPNRKIEIPTAHSAYDTHKRASNASSKKSQKSQFHFALSQRNVPRWRPPVTSAPWVKKRQKRPRRTRLTSENLPYTRKRPPNAINMMRLAPKAGRWWCNTMVNIGKISRGEMIHFQRKTIFFHLMGKMLKNQSTLDAESPREIQNL